MKLAKITNTSEKMVTVKTTQGLEIFLDPGDYIENIDATNIDDIKESVKIIHNLNETNSKYK
jgi:hypothetical protein